MHNTNRLYTSIMHKMQIVQALYTYLIQADYITTSIIHIISVVPVLSKIISEPATFI